MTKKKMIYTGVGALAIILGYLNYFGEDKKIDTLKKVIETTNAVYKGADYIIEAKKQIDYVDDKESKFELAKAIVKGMTLSGDNVVLDKLKNLILKNNIVGLSPNGWKINASELRYIKDRDELVSDSGVSAINEEKGIHLEGKRFLTTSSMSHILLEDGVIFEVEQAGLRGKRAEYVDETKKITLTGDVQLYNAKPEGKQFEGSFENLVYDIKQEYGETDLPFEIRYEGFQIFAEYLKFSPKTNHFFVKDHIKVEQKEKNNQAEAESIEKKEGQDIVVAMGVQGRNPDYSYRFQKAEYDMQKKEVILSGNIEIQTTKGERLEADKAIYHEEDKTLDVFGESKNAIYTGQGHRVEGKAFHYDTKTGILLVNSKYRYTNAEGDVFEGNHLEYNKETQNAVIKGEVEYQSKDYRLKTRDLDYNKETGILHMKNPYELVLEDGSIFRGKSASYNEKTGDLHSPGAISMDGPNYQASGRDVVYNNKTGKGTMQGPVKMWNHADRMEVSGERLQFEKDKGAELLGKVQGNLQGTYVETQRAIYADGEKTLTLPNSIQYKNAEQSLHGTMSKGIYWMEEHKFIGDDFVGIRPNETLKGKKAQYFTDRKEVILEGQVVLESKEQSLKTEKANYFLETKDANIPGTFTVLRPGMEMTGKEAQANTEKQSLKAKEPKVKTENGDYFEAKRMEGDLASSTIDFYEKLYGKTLDKKGVVSEYRGEKAKLHLVKDSTTKKYRAKKIEVFEDAVFTQEDKKLTGKHGEFDLDSNMADFQGDVTFVSQQGNIRADRAIYNANTKKAKATGNVRFNYDDGKKE